MPISEEILTTWKAVSLDIESQRFQLYTDHERKSRRERIATAVLAGIYAGRCRSSQSAYEAVKAADDLIAELDKTNG